MFFIFLVFLISS